VKKLSAGDAVVTRKKTALILREHKQELIFNPRH